MRLDIARCSVEYAGRLSAHLPLATRLLIHKNDGSPLVHSGGGSYKPLNWISRAQVCIPFGARFGLAGWGDDPMSGGEKRMVDELSTGELRLRVLSIDDADELHVIFSDPHTHTIGEGPFQDLEQTRMWLRRRAERRAEHGIAWYGVRLPDGEFIGTAGLFIGRSGTEPELGFEIRQPDQGKGYGTRAATAVVAEAHRVGFARVWATVRPWNIASFRALARVGFTEDRTEDDDRGKLTYLLHHSDEGRQPSSVEQ